MIEHIAHDGKLIALIVKAGFEKDGIEFFTPPDFSQQLGYMKRPRGYVIPPHIHKPVARAVEYTQEVLFVKSGRVRVNFYAEDRSFLLSRDLQPGDVILLAHGGHGFEMLEESALIEIKQGPYAGDDDKERFEPGR